MVIDANMGNTIIKVIMDPDFKAGPIVIVKNTFASWLWARDSAHSLKYDAVFDMHPSTNSTVSINWWITISVISKSFVPIWWCPSFLRTPYDFSN